jgi:hypothetical protein
VELGIDDGTVIALSRPIFASVSSGGKDLRDNSRNKFVGLDGLSGAAPSCWFARALWPVGLRAREGVIDLVTSFK